MTAQAARVVPGEDVRTRIGRHPGGHGQPFPWGLVAVAFLASLLLGALPGRAAEYPIVYNANGGTGTIPDGVKAEGVDATVSDGKGFTRRGYTFVGWATSPKGGGVFAWGLNTEGQTTMPRGATNVVAIAAGDNHSLVLKQDGAVIAWGYNYSQQATVPRDLVGVTAIAARGDHTLVLKQDGTVASWGDVFNAPTAMPAGLTAVTSITAGVYEDMFFRRDGSITIWNRISSGVNPIPADFTDAVAIEAGLLHSVALKRDGTVVAWWRGGTYNNYGQAVVPVGLTGVVTISAGYAHTVALKQDGTVVAWGGTSLGKCRYRTTCGA